MALTTIGFLKVDGIQGDSPDNDHKGWIEILGYNHAVRLPVAVHGANVAIGSKLVEHSPFQFQKSIDSSSPMLALYCCQGKNIDSVTFALVRQANAQKLTYMTYVLSDAKVTSVTPGGVGSEAAGLPTETVAFSYSKIKWTYSKFDPKTGATQGGDVPAGWDVVNGVSF